MTSRWKPRFGAAVDEALGAEARAVGAPGAGARTAAVWAIADLEELWRTAERSGREQALAAPRDGGLAAGLVWMTLGALEGAALAALAAWCW